MVRAGMRARERGEKWRATLPDATLVEDVICLEDALDSEDEDRTTTWSIIIAIAEQADTGAASTVCLQHPPSTHGAKGQPSPLESLDRPSNRVFFLVCLNEGDAESSQFPISRSPQKRSKRQMLMFNRSLTEGEGGYVRFYFTRILAESLKIVKATGLYLIQQRQVTVVMESQEQRGGASTAYGTKDRQKIGCQVQAQQLPGARQVADENKGRGIHCNLFYSAPHRCKSRVCGAPPSGPSCADWRVFFPVFILFN